jgi:phage/plasmid-associated DNA primase
LDALIKEAVAFCKDDRELPCEAIKRESEKYQESQDALGSFLKDAFESRSKISTVELFNLYKASGSGKLGKVRFFIEVEQRGYKKKHTEKGDEFSTPEDEDQEADKVTSNSRNFLYTRDNEKLRQNGETLSAAPSPMAADIPEPPKNPYETEDQRALWEAGEVF